MYPYLLSIGGYQVHSYGFMMALSFIAGLVHWIWLGRTRGYTRNTCVDLMILVMLSGIFGARIAFILENLDVFLDDPVRMFMVNQGGLVFYGGLAAAGVGVVLFGKIRHLAIVPLIDFTLTAVPLSHAVGRIGCFLNSCCFGRICNHSGGVQYPKYSQPWHLHLNESLIDAHASQSLPVYPVQLYEAGFNIAVYIILVSVFLRRRERGIIAAVYLILYSFGRFFLEYFRGDHAARVSMAGLSMGQIVSIPLFVIGCVMLLMICRFPHLGDGCRVDDR